MKMVLVRALALAGVTASVFSGTPVLAQGAAQAAPVGRSAPLPPYRVNPGDEIEVYVWGEERLQRTLRVLPDGSFSFPLAGRIEAAGKLPSELEAAISRGLASQFRDQVPQVTVSIRSPSGFQVSVIGKVRSPGTLTPGRYINVLEAVFIAGGPTDFAKTNDIVILRKTGSGVTPIRVRLSDAIKGDPSARDLAGIPELQSGDTVVVP
ncbi:polysaccharide biosynthesis/export family protein [Sphingomonas sp. KR1UV-12]|uniref:Polysaccharide biosynthesis/export family protein n=1 Tax=Sphingomonas aurea TaxID=3063994 RepID=A0ABT9EJK4_9SPHN|nr:polysaccharide biosynthesis/export family protein [Sphingomonas sp. KR1UV-12]MDP1027144.1 polysaccharide biosynthesis/export family protein [Sphingomonas sp. KR1UV-12]